MDDEAEPLDDDDVIYEMEVFIILDELEARGMIERYIEDGEDFYRLTPAGVEEANARAAELGFDSADELGRVLFGEDGEAPPELN